MSESINIPLYTTQEVLKSLHDMAFDDTQWIVSVDESDTEVEWEGSTKAGKYVSKITLTVAPGHVSRVRLVRDACYSNTSECDAANDNGVPAEETPAEALPVEVPVLEAVPVVEPEVLSA